MTCFLGYKDRPCLCPGNVDHYFVTVYRTGRGWAVRTERHFKRRRSGGGRTRQQSGRHFVNIDDAQTYAVEQGAKCRTWLPDTPVHVELGLALR